MKQTRRICRWLALLPVALGIVAGTPCGQAQRPLGIDVSSYQGSGIDWTSVKASGVTFAWAKAAEGTATDGWVGEDADFTINEANAKAAGVIVGAYYYCHPESDPGLSGADAEAQFFWNIASPYMKNGGYYMMPMLDFEQNVTGAGYTASTLSAWLNEWCKDIVNDAAAEGIVVKPVVYTFISYANGTGGYGPGLDNTVTQWPLDMANVEFTDPQTGAPVETYPWSTWEFWQYNWLASVPGISGNCDLDVFNGTGQQFTNNYVIGGGAAAIYYWDPQGTSGGNPYTGSMSGTWESQSWSTGSAGQATPTSWLEAQCACFGVNTGAGTPAFTVTANSNHVFAGIFDGPLGPNSCNVTINGKGILTLANGPQGFSMLTSGDGSQAYITISNQISGTGQMVPEGYGQLSLYGTNTFSGGTSLGYAGSPFFGYLNFNNGSAFGIGPITLQSLGNGGSFVLQGSSPVTIANPVNVTTATTNIFVGNAAGLTFSGPWTLGNNLLTLHTGASTTSLVNISGPISGAAGFTMGGLGTLTLSGSNTYTGTTTVASGTLRLGGSNGIPSASSLFIANGANFDMNGNSASIATLGGAYGAALPCGNVISNNGTLTINGASGLNTGEAGSGAFSGVISGSGGVVISGGGSTTFSGANSYAGATIVAGGTLIPSHPGCIPSGSSITVNSPGLLDIVNVNETIPSLSGTGTVNLESGTLTVGSALGSTFWGVIENAAASYTNGNSVNGLQGFYFPTITFGGTPVIRVDSTVNFSDLTQASQNPIYPITNQFSVRWLGQLLTAGTAGSYTFTTTSDDGSRLWINGTLVVDNWNFQPATSRSNSITLSANTKYDIRLEYMQGPGGASCVLKWTPPGGTSAVIPSSNLFTYSGVGGLVKTGGGVFRLLGTNTYAGTTTISSGTLALAGRGSISNTSAIILAAGSTFDVSAISSFALGPDTTLTASGTANPATIKGTGAISLGSQPILLNFDGADPALTISQGTLLLDGNSFTVNGPQLGIGTYTLVQQNSGNILNTGMLTVNGSTLGTPGTAAAIWVNGNRLLLTIAQTKNIAGTITEVSTLNSGAVQLNFTGTPGFVYLIEGATNLTPPITWTILSTNIADSTGAFGFTDFAATNFVDRFYRTAAH